MAELRGKTLEEVLTSDDVRRLFGVVFRVGHRHVGKEQRRLLAGSFCFVHHDLNPQTLRSRWRRIEQHGAKPAFGLAQSHDVAFFDGD